MASKNKVEKEMQVVEADVNEKKTIATQPARENATRNTGNASTQMQLLTLAKRFALDGALLPAEKQPPLEDRAHKRERVLHLRQQHNLESIIQKAIAYCDDDKVAEKADQDWFNYFIKQAEDISNSSMQELWAKILAKELSQPGSFSIRAMKTFRTLSILDAKLLAKVASVSVKDSNRKNVRIISGAMQQPGLFNFFNKQRITRVDLSQFGLSYTELLTLADNHLLFIQEAESSLLTAGQHLGFNFQGAHFKLVARRSNCVLSFYKFTPVGTEIINLIGDSANEGFFDTMQEALSYHFSIDK